MEDRIEKYYRQELTPLEKEELEKNLIQDPQLAEEMAFYLQTRQAIREEILAERHAGWQKLAQPAQIRRTKTPWYYAAAAVLIMTFGIGWYFLNQTATTDQRQLAAAYVEDNLTNLPTQMDGQKDSLQTAVSYYNEGKYSDAQKWAESLLGRNPENAEVLRVAGLAALQSKNYDQAIAHFQQLAAQPDLFENPGKFYEAIAHLMRGEPLNKITADSLLNVVIVNNLDGSEEAMEWLERE